VETEYEVRLWEDKVKKDNSGRIIHHPLNGPYRFSTGADMPSYGHLTFGGHDLAESSILSDVKVFYLEFFGEPPSTLDREAWADPLRAEALQRLSHQSRAWYLSFIGDLPDTTSSTGYVSIDEELRRDLIKNEALNFAIVRSERQYGYGKGFRTRLFVETPNRLLSNLIARYWPRAYPGDPIEGYSIASGQIEALGEWDKKLRDDQLFREVIDQVFVAFYTYPEEHRHFVFVTNKLDLNDMKQLLDLESLQQQAKELGGCTKP